LQPEMPSEIATLMQPPWYVGTTGEVNRYNMGEMAHEFHWVRARKETSSRFHQAFFAVFTARQRNLYVHET
jgi:hypothetical protein